MADRSLALAHRIAAVAADRQASDITVLDMREVASYTDYFVVCTARNTRSAQAIVDAVRMALKTEDGVSPRRINGEREATWILMDYLDVVVHVFLPETRAYYDLDRLWGQVPSERLAS